MACSGADARLSTAARTESGLKAMIEKIQHDQAITELKLSRPPVNALDPELVGVLAEDLRQCVEDGAEAVVVSGQPGMFSAGLDVPTLLQLDRDGMAAFWTDFFGLLETIARCRVPVVAALTGHSPAGGTVLALFADYRVMAKGEFRMGLNEVQVGLVVPPLIHRALARLIGDYPAERHLVAGDMIDSAAAVHVGLVDEVADPDAVIERALAWCRRHLALPRHAMLATRELVRADLCRQFDDPDALDIQGFVDGWFQPETQASLKQLVERLKKG